MNLKLLLGLIAISFVLLVVKSDEPEEDVVVFSFAPEQVDNNWKTFKSKHNRRYRNKTQEAKK